MIDPWLGNYKKSIEYYKQALDIKQRVLGERHPETATTLNDIGTSFPPHPCTNLVVCGTRDAPRSAILQPGQICPNASLLAFFLVDELVLF